MRHLVFAFALLAACDERLPAAAPLSSEDEELIELCSSACAHLRALGCPEGRGTVGGESCSSVCVRASGLRPLPLACWSAATTTASAKACGALRCIH